MRSIIYITTATAGVIAFFAMLMISGVFNSVPFATAINGSAKNLIANENAPVKIKNIAIADEYSEKIRFDTRPDTERPYAIQIIAVNDGSIPIPIDADSWFIQLSNEDGSLKTTKKDITKGMHVREIPAKSSAILTKVDLSEHEDILALFPGTYNLEITGMKHMVMPLKEPLPTPSGEPDVVVDLTGEEMNAIGVGSENGVDGRQGLFPVHVVKVSFEATYDVEDIKARQNKVLKAEGMAASIQGEGNLHDITPAEPKKVDFYLVNDGDEPISALIRSTSFVLFNAQNREAAAGTSGFYDTISEACDVLQPGERLLIKSYDFAVDKFPLNDKLITKKLGANEDKAIPGTYIAYIKATTADCTTADGQDVRGGNNVLIAAFEVRQ